MPRKYSIVIGEDNQVVVVPSSWLIEDKKFMFWPEGNSNITGLIINNVDPKDDWIKFKVSKYIKSSDTYTDAIAEMKTIANNCENLTDPSDEEKLKQSRSDRHRKHLSDYYVDAVDRKRKRNIENVDKENIAYKENVQTPFENENRYENLTQNLKIAIPGTLNITNLSQLSKNTTVMKEIVGQIEETNCSDQDLLKNILGNQKLILQKLYAIEMYVNKLTANMNKGSYDPIETTLTEKNLKIINKYFPVDEKEKFLFDAEEKLSKASFYKIVYNHLRNIGGINPKAHCDLMVKCLIVDQVLTGYSYTGQSKKEKAKNKCFSQLNINNVIHCCMKTVYSNVNIDDVQIKKYVSAYLDSASVRIERADSIKNSRSPMLKPLHLNFTTASSEDSGEENL